MVSLWPWGSAQPSSGSGSKPGRSTSAANGYDNGKEGDIIDRMREESLKGLKASPPEQQSQGGGSWWPWSSGSQTSAGNATAQAATSMPKGSYTVSNGSWPQSSPQSPPPGLSASTSLPPIDVLIAKADAKLNSWSSSPTILVLGSVAIGGVAATGLGFFWGRYGRRLRNADWITPEWLGGQRWIRGVVTSVGDGDNFRVFHTPRFGGYHWPLKLRRIPNSPKDLKNKTLHVRLAGVDAPESSYFGKPEQPGAAVAKTRLREYLLGRKVYCQLIRKDQYNRIVAHVHRPWKYVIPGSLFKGPNVSKMMLKEGHAVVYEQAGAEYGKDGKEAFLALEENARRGRRGLWALPTGESPAEYKKRHAQLTDRPEGVSKVSKGS